MRLNGPPIILDRAIRASNTGRLMAIISAALLALASGQDPATPLFELVESRAKPLYETLKSIPPPGWPLIDVSWDAGNSAHVRVQNGPAYVLGLRLRLDGPDITSGQALPVWDNQFFDLLPGEVATADVSLVTAGQQRLGALTLVVEKVGPEETQRYELRRSP